MLVTDVGDEMRNTLCVGDNIAMLVTDVNNINNISKKNFTACCKQSFWSLKLVLSLIGKWIVLNNSKIVMKVTKFVCPWNIKLEVGLCNSYL